MCFGGCTSWIPELGLGWCHGCPGRKLFETLVHIDSKSRLSQKPEVSEAAGGFEGTHLQAARLSRLNRDTEALAKRSAEAQPQQPSRGKKAPQGEKPVPDSAAVLQIARTALWNQLPFQQLSQAVVESERGPLRGVVAFAMGCPPEAD